VDDQLLAREHKEARARPTPSTRQAWSKSLSAGQASRRWERGAARRWSGPLVPSGSV